MDAEILLPRRMAAPVTKKDKKTVEVVYLITSDHDAGPATLAARVRSHREIENKLHGVRESCRFPLKGACAGKGTAVADGEDALRNMACSMRQDGTRSRRAASHPGSQHIDLAAWRERVEAVLDQPADRLQASQRPPRADHVEVDIGAVAGDDVAKVLLVSERQVVATILWNWVQATPPIRRLCDLAPAG